jgi:hypothetical protein
VLAKQPSSAPPSNPSIHSVVTGVLLLLPL